MSSSTRALLGCLMILAMGVGCHSEAGPLDTGSRGAAKDYYEALRRRDWTSAYSLLHPESRARCNSAQFAPLAARYRDNIGFEPQEVHIRAHEEHGSEAIVHIVWMGQQAGRQKFYKDALCLHRNGTAWGVVLPASFGRSRRR